MRLTRFRALAFAGALLVPLSLAAARPRAQGDLLDRAVAAWAKVRTVRATFEQTITNSLTGRTLTATGEYQQQRPGKLSVRFSQPANERIVADGSRALALSAEHDARTGHPHLAQERRQRNGRPHRAVPHRAAFALHHHRERRGRGLRARDTRVRPRTEAEAGRAVRAATVWIDDEDATIRQFEVTEPSGLVRRVRLTSFRPNAPVDASAFTFTVPEGVRIVDR